MNNRILKGKIFKGMAYAGAIISLLALVTILGSILHQALPSLSWAFIFTAESDVEGLGGGVANAVIGTVLLSVLSPLLATPLAIGTAVYLKRYATNEKLVKSLSFMLDVLSGTPSIVLGIFGLLFIVIYMREVTGGFSLISGVIALAILILPVIERATEEAIDTVPQSLEEGSYALGATKWHTIRDITLPYALSGILTGIVLSIGRAAEESAVVILTAGYTQFSPELKVAANEKLIFGVKVYPFQDLIAALPITVYKSFEFPHLIDPSQGFAAAVVLIFIVMVINFTTRLIVWRRRIG
ncbi:phosphate transport system permease protein [Methanohalophilus levihalophilus]|uniref:phosphate ABC transporter permease PstA n=1 Tax=Methanohalophilus levihalophilus TaxID=1431282 RepID=UPI001AE55FD5|nr:phosphate ABC transporter permease PstA [Methanohalophilus levihalophilus]MBP2029446.1 phosphate transport system permease protein [Methanohalophilus levihalophilus]